MLSEKKRGWSNSGWMKFYALNTINIPNVFIQYK